VDSFILAIKNKKQEALSFKAVKVTLIPLQKKRHSREWRFKILKKNVI
jgi:hypothetical protein